MMRFGEIEPLFPNSGTSWNRQNAQDAVKAILVARIIEMDKGDVPIRKEKPF
jgi:hypothetical protein